MQILSMTQSKEIKSPKKQGTTSSEIEYSTQHYYRWQLWLHVMKGPDR